MNGDLIAEVTAFRMTVQPVLCDMFDACFNIEAQMNPTYYDLFEWLCREERESPEAWSHICVQKLAELAKESTTMRRILDPMLSYFDMKKQWAPRHGLALLVLSDMSYLENSLGKRLLPRRF